MNKWCSIASALGIDELRRDAVRGKTVAIRIQGFRLILMMRHEPALEVFPFRDEKLRCGKVIQLVNLNAGCLDRSIGTLLIPQDTVQMTETSNLLFDKRGRVLLLYLPSILNMSCR